MKLFAIAMAALMFATAAYAAPFSDVPRTHWAYDAIQKAVDAGVLQGYDGKFEGARLLNRYQMAVVVAKLLDAMKTAAPAGRMGAPEDVKKMVANLEALTIEFADELALLNVKVSTLEDSFHELKQQVAVGIPARGSAAPAGGLGFTAFASFGLSITDDEANDYAYVDWDPIAYDGTLSNDSTYFDMPQVSLGIDKEVNPGVFFHAQFDFDASVNGIFGGGVAVNEAFFFVDEIFGDIGGKVGAFALPFSMEHDGPFRTCTMTVTPSMVNTLVESVRGYGLELQRTKDVSPEDMFFKFGIISGVDEIDFVYPYWSKLPVAAGQTFEYDDGFGFYVQVGKKPTAKGGFGWNLAYLDNGGDYNGEGSSEVSFLNLGLEWSCDDLRVLAQYMDGESDEYGDGTKDEFTLWYLLVNYRIDDKQSVSLRYEKAEAEYDGSTYDEVDGITFAWNRKVTANSMLQLEYLMPDNEGEDEKDDLLQIRYKVHF